MKGGLWKYWLVLSLMATIVIYFLTAVNPLILGEFSDFQLFDTYYVTQNWVYLLICFLLLLMLTGAAMLIYKVIGYFHKRG